MDGDIEYVRREVEEHGIELSVAATIRIRDDDGTIDEYTVTPLQVRVASALATSQIPIGHVPGMESPPVVRCQRFDQVPLGRPHRH
jgi:hypothetical protein